MKTKIKSKKMFYEIFCHFFFGNSEKSTKMLVYEDE